MNHRNNFVQNLLMNFMICFRKKLLLGIVIGEHVINLQDSSPIKQASVGVLAIFVIRMVKLVVDTIIHGYALHSIYGWSLHLLGAV